MIKALFISLLLANFARAAAEKSLGAGVRPESLAELEEAYRRELKFLEKTLESLKRESLAATERLERGRREAEREVQRLERETVSEKLKVEALSREVVELERWAKDEQRSEQDQRALFERLVGARRGLMVHLGLEPDTLGDEGQPDLRRLAELGRQLVADVERLSGVTVREGVYLDEQNRFMAGPIARVGAFGALAQTADGALVLGPGAGTLKAIEAKRYPQVGEWLSGQLKSVDLIPVYLFESLDEKLRLTRPATWQEAVAGSTPIVMLALLSLVVAWLFWRLARI